MNSRFAAVTVGACLLALPSIVVAEPDDVSTQGTSVAFVVGHLPGSHDHQDAYTLVLSSSSDIAMARSIMADPWNAPDRIVMARIEPGADGVNRNHAVAGAPPWSWHITEFIGFAGVTPEIYDGWPRFVEEDVPGWMHNTQGIIGFWNYTVVAELPGVPVPPCGLADVGAAGGVAGGDGALDNNDFIVFIGLFFGGDTRADRGAAGGAQGSDGLFDNNDFIVFIDQFFAGC